MAWAASPPTLCTMPLLFSYGALREAPTQMAIFGRLLEGEPDELVGFAQSVSRNP
jgi:hypothetical protein